MRLTTSTTLLMATVLVPLCAGAIELFIPPSQPVRNCSYGSLQGYKVTSPSLTEAEVFLGIPYAQPPTGDLRFKNPIPPKPWRGVRQVTQAPPLCIQFWYENPNAKTTKVQSEDCLYLNLIAPKFKKGKLYPVLLWIHGGSYQVGGANSFPVPQTVDQFTSRGVITVFVNYRLGALGYLSFMNKDCAGNFGLRDQIAALQWVYENIHNFGGDKSQITVTGESAGAASASLIAVSPLAKGMVKQVVVRSGSSLAPWAVRSRSTDMNSISLAEHVGCVPNYVGAAEILRCLRESSVDKLIDGWRSIASNDIAVFFEKNHQPINGNHPALAHTFFTPVVDSFLGADSALPTYAEQLVTENANIPIMIGGTTAECTGYGMWIAHAESQGFPAQFTDLEYVIPNVLYGNPEHVKFAASNHYIDRHIGNANFSRFQALIQIASDIHFIVPAVREAEIYAKKGLPVFSYSFDYQHTTLNKRFISSGLDLDVEMGGAAHGYDNVFLFKSSAVLDQDVIELVFSPKDLEISEFLVETLTNFIKYGDPSGEANLNLEVNVSAPMEHCNHHHYLWPRFRPEFGDQIYISEQKMSVTSGFDWKFFFWRDTVPTIEALKLQGGYNFYPPAYKCDVELDLVAKYKTAFYTCLGGMALLIMLTWASCIVACRRRKRKFPKRKVKAARSDLDAVAKDETSLYDTHSNGTLLNSL